MKFFTINKPRGFNYTPRFYDARKEASKNREERIKRELGIASEDEKVNYSSSIKGQFQKARKVNAKKRSTSTFIIFLLLLAIAYLILQNPRYAELFGFK